MIALARRRHLRRLLAARTTPSDRAARVALPAPPAGVGSQGDAPSPYRRRVVATTAWASYGLDPHPVAVVGCFAVLCAAFAAAVHAIRNA
jgi:hypothetical protein